MDKFGIAICEVESGVEAAGSNHGHDPIHKQ
jgi:hypothetical protein